MMSSLLHLVKNNEGKFRSEKQADFFMRLFEGLYSINKNYYGNPIQWDISFDSTGIQLVTKNTIKGGEVVFWENTPEHLQALREAEDRREADKKLGAIAHFENCKKYSYELISELFKEYKISFDKADEMKSLGISEETIREVQESYRVRINKAMSDYQESIAWTLPYIK